MFTSTQPQDTGGPDSRDPPDLSSADNASNPATTSNNNPPQTGTASNASGRPGSSSSPFGGINGNEEINSNQQTLTPKQIEELMVYLQNNTDHHYQHDTLHPVTDDGGTTRNSTATVFNGTGRTLVDLLILSIHGFLNMFYHYPSTGSDELTSEEKKLLLLSDEELDNLALIQGPASTYLDLHVGKVSPRKIEKMEDLLKDENHIEWELRCRRLMIQGALQNDLMRGLDVWRGKLRGFLGSWGGKKCSENVYLLDDQLTAHRIPMVNQTDGVRGKVGVTDGKHAWDFKVVGQIGTHFSVGLSTDKGPLISTKGYVSLIGGDEKGESWGWDLVWGNLSHKGRTIGDYPRFIVYQYTPGDIIRLTVDCDKGDMSFAVNEMFFGIAVKNLPRDVPLYPAVGMVYGNMEVSCVYLGVPPRLRN